MVKADDLSQSPTALDQEKILICAVELSRSSGLIAGMLPGIDRQMLKMIEPDPVRLIGQQSLGATMRSRPVGR